MKLIKLSSAALLAMLAMGTATTVAHAAEIGNIPTVGDVSYHANPTPDPVDPINPDDPDDPTPVDPVDPVDPIIGPLSLDFVPTIHFGDQEITTQDKTYYSQGEAMKSGAFKSHFAQVTDNRGTFAGWNLTVKQEADFKNPDASGKPGEVLTGAKITLGNGRLVSDSSVPADNVAATTELVPGTASVIMSAAEGTGSGTNAIAFGDSKTKGESVSLTVPGSTAKLVGTYTTDLTWTISDVPAV